MLAGSHLGMPAKIFDVFEHGWARRRWNELDKFFADQLFSGFGKIAAIGVIDKRQSCIGQKATNQFCLSIDDVTISSFTLMLWNQENP